LRVGCGEELDAVVAIVAGDGLGNMSNARVPLAGSDDDDDDADGDEDDEDEVYVVVTTCKYWPRSLKCGEFQEQIGKRVQVSCL
jgi:hypothetical protein